MNNGGSISLQYYKVTVRIHSIQQFSLFQILTKAYSQQRTHQKYRYQIIEKKILRNFKFFSYSWEFSFWKIITFCNSFELTKKRSRRYPAKTITNANYADDIAILANAPAQDETLLHSLERASAGMGFHVNAHKTEYMCYNQTGDISTQDGTPLKLIDKFTYLGSSVSSTENDINTRLTKAWTANYRLSIWKSDLTDKMKHSFFQPTIVSVLLYGLYALHGR